MTPRPDRSVRDEAIRWARAVAADPAAVVVDSETTGTGGDAEICDLAIVGMDGRVLLDTFVQPLGRIPAAAAAIHGITDAVLDRAKAPMWRELWPRVATILHPGRTVLAYNAEFDFRILNQVSLAAKLPPFAPGWQCPMLNYAAFEGSTVRRMSGREEFRWHKLGEACAAMGVELSGAHRALADAQATRLLILAMAAAEVEAEAPEQMALFG